jgi:prepilin-type N-terminal cleavage/methylation domain-containing protein
MRKGAIGFTLIELLVTVTVVLLMSVSLLILLGPSRWQTRHGFCSGLRVKPGDEPSESVETKVQPLFRQILRGRKRQ